MVTPVTLKEQYYPEEIRKGSSNLEYLRIQVAQQSSCSTFRMLLRTVYEHLLPLPEVRLEYSLQVCFLVINCHWIQMTLGRDWTRSHEVRDAGVFLENSVGVFL